MFIGIGMALQRRASSGPPAPVNSVAPVISGTPSDGQVLTSTTGTWSGSPTYAYQWKRGATNVGTNASTYTLVTADIGSNMTCVVTATNAGGSANATSNSLGPIVAAASAWNPADKSANATLSNSNRTAAVPSVGTREGTRGTLSRATGNWHFEFTQTTGSQSSIGVSDGSQALNRHPGTDGGFLGVGMVANGTIFFDGGISGVAGDAFTTGDVVAVEWNASTGQVWFEKLGGTGRKGPVTSVASTAMFPKVCLEASVVASATINTGQAAFAITPTSGFSAWG